MTASNLKISEKMKEITRSEAESLFQENAVVKRHIQQSNQELSIVMAISDNTSLIVKYNVPKQTKHYYLDMK